MAEPEHLLTVNIVTPDGQIYSHRAVYVEMRATDGDMTIMHDHMPIVAPLEISEVKIQRSQEMNHKLDEIAVSGGYVEFSNNEATIIAGSAERAGNIDAERALAAKERAEKHIAEAKAKHNDRERLENEIALRRAINRLNVRKHFGQ
ncbi:F0F1 ATP synthase subunit epsilon [Lactobacillus rodentium]|uniref:ATP synthase epsilon chain n=1 Tax=Lactobacillus rodentium TaxID=947835 RepID=A0A2Z6T8D9_9LACO|nr:F0F1 ATP synthase subunit epsilon [Lactobacillus rodentium]MCR1894322.1 F0F1 ATP synthase subunit epsilon [Lactobacillus rodentium]GBG04618.1 F0F1 ATP synthase subunit epsilon [Lactobacillus rodentium]